MSELKSWETESQTPTAPFDKDKAYIIPMRDIFADEDFNCRGFIDPMKVIDLAKDIAMRDLTQPITVEPWTKEPGKKFRIIAGYRRHKAHVMNEAKSIRAMVMEGLSDLQARSLNLSENLQRENLTIKQEAHAIDHFRRAGWSEIQTANEIKMSRGWVQVRFMLLELPDEIQDEASAGFLTNQQIRNLWAMSDVEQQYAYVRAVKDAKLLKKKREVKPSSVKKDNERRIRNQQEMEEMQDRIIDCLGHGPDTKALGWAMGFLSDFEFEKFVADRARERGKFWQMTPGIEYNRAPQIDRVKESMTKI